MMKIHFIIDSTLYKRERDGENGQRRSINRNFQNEKTFQKTRNCQSQWKCYHCHHSTIIPQEKMFLMLLNFWLNNKERLLTSKTEPTETLLLKPKSLPEKDLNCIKEHQIMDSFFSVEESWIKTQLPKRN